MDELISVVIPCYNVERYAAKCLQSVLSQTYGNIEVIVVDDGSTDGTTDILERYTSDKRVKLLKQANSGVSSSRNAGIEASAGELLMFVDSDDYLEMTMCEKLYTAITRGNADMAVCNYNLVYDDRIDMEYSKIHNETIDVYDDVYGYFCKYCACPKPNNYIWTRIYKSGILKRSGVRFEQYKLGDDTLFNFKLLPYIRRVTFVKDGLYNYLQRSNSNVYTIAKKRNLAEEYADTFDSLASFYSENKFDEFLQVLPLHAFTRMRSVFFYSRLAGMSEDEIIQSIKSGFKNRVIADYLTGKL